MNKRQVCREAARRAGVKNPREAELLFNECLRVMADALMEGELVHINPIGILVAKFDKRPHIRNRVLKLIASRKFNRRLRGAQTEYPDWYKKISGD